MTFLLHLLIAFLICIVFAALIIAYNVYRSFKNVRNKFNDINTGSYEKWAGERREQDVVKDQVKRGEKKKIFSENEGEYVDFEEE